MAYLYRHIRLDKNVPFYIGIGKDESKYNRAFEKTKRNPHWKNIIAKTPYRVLILLDGLDWDYACEKEVEFIALYGRNDLGKGFLVNLTDGGDGTVNYIFTEDQKRKISEKGKGRVGYWKNRKHTKETKIKISLKLTGGHHADESKKKMSNKLKNRKLSKEHRRNLSKRVITDEWRKNMSIAQKKRIRGPHSEETKRKIAKGNRKKKPRKHKKKNNE